jgi:hypothetical protein
VPSVRYLPIAGVLGAALALSAPAFAGPPKGACRDRGCAAYSATQAFERYVFKHTVPPGGSLAVIGFASFGCRAAGERHYHCEVASQTCAVTGIVVERKEETYSFRSISTRGSCPKWYKTAPPRPTPAPPPTATPGGEEALSATLIIHVYTERHSGVANCEEVVRAKPPEAGVAVECRGNVLWEKRQEQTPVLITRIGAGVEALGELVTSETTVHVVPGLYEIAREKVTVSAGQTLEVTLKA